MQSIMITKEDFEKYKEVNQKLEDIGYDLQDILGDSDFSITHEGEGHFSIHERGRLGGSDEYIITIGASIEELAVNRPAFALATKFHQKMDEKRAAEKARADEDNDARERKEYERLKAKFEGDTI
jgi:hypothetical protein